MRLRPGLRRERLEGSEQTALIAVNAPFSRTPYVGQTIADGAQLAADEVTIDTDDGKLRFRIKRYDTGLSARRAVANVRRALADGAVAIIDEGTGINASWRLARDADRPTCITYQGGWASSTRSSGRTCSASPPPTTGRPSGSRST